MKEDSEGAVSIYPDGRTIGCDGQDCDKTALLPVALHRSRDTAPSDDVHTRLAGWLFAGSQGMVRHFCPRCAPRHFPQVKECT